MEKIQKTETCWNWTAATITSRGQAKYGVFGPRRGKMILAHRFSYELFVGPIPNKYEVDHLCRNTLCVRPDHLEAVTSSVNNLRSNSITSQHAHQTHCSRGHDYATHGRVKANGHRRCRTCNVQWQRDRKTQRKESKRH